MKLRPYQQQCLNCIYSGIKSGIRLQVVVMSTGSGKTVIFSQLPPILKKQGKKTLILAHREELLKQAKEKIEKLHPEVSVSVDQGSNKCDLSADVIVASVATLGRENSSRIEKFNPEDFGLIIVDEAHRVVSNSYTNVLNYFGASKRAGLSEKHPVLIGFTATPSRSDKVGLDTVFDKLVFSYTIKNGIEEGFLVRINAFSIYTQDSLDKVGTTAGDFNIGDLSDTVNNKVRNKLIVETYLSKANDKAIVFAVNVQHCFDLEKEFISVGINAKAIVGTTPKEERKQILEDYDKGKITVIINCSVLVEGYDSPSISTVLMARPTKSQTVYSQAIGRGLRTYPGKEKVKIFDFVDNMKNNSIVTSSSIIGLDRPIRANNTDILKVAEKFDELLENAPKTDVSTVDIDKLDTLIKSVDIFAMAELSDLVKVHSKLAWTMLSDNLYKISLGSNSHAIIERNMLDQWDIKITTSKEQKPSFMNGWKKWAVTNSKDLSAKELSEAFSVADTEIKKDFPSCIGLVLQKTGWRNDTPSEGQLKWLKKFGVNNPEKLSKGQASQLLSKYFDKKKS